MANDDEIDKDWVKVLSGPLKGKSPKGEGWKTMSEIKDEMDCGICKARRIIKQMIEEGKIESFVGSAQSSSVKDLCRQVWYRPVRNKR